MLEKLLDLIMVIPRPMVFHSESQHESFCCTATSSGRGGSYGMNDLKADLQAMYTKAGREWLTWTGLA